MVKTDIWFPNDHSLNVSIPNAANNVQNMLMSNGQSIDAHTNIFSTTFFPMSSLTDHKTNRICKLDCFLANASSIVNEMSELEECVRIQS